MKRILIVEDNSNNRDLLSTILRFHGYETVMANNGAEAIPLVRQVMPDLILMDLSMPVLDGFEATRLIKQDPEIAHIPIIAVSAFDSLEAKEAALAAGCEAFISKPLNMFTLKVFLESVMAAR